MAGVSTTPARSTLFAMEGDHRGRYRSLDALRGIAAVVVVIHHCLMTLPLFSDVVLHGTHRAAIAVIFGYPPLNLLWAGDAAVKVFFALSGFVLALMFLRPDPPGYAAFCVKRICRIYIPYSVVVAGALLLMTTTLRPHTPELSEWFHASWNHSITWPLIWDHALMLGQPKYNFVDNPIWSLVHEMRYSLVFPMIMWLVTRLGWRRLVAASLGLSVIAMSAMSRTGDYWAIDSLQYAFLFVAGAVLAKHQSGAAAWFQSLSRRCRMALSLAALLLLSAHGIAHSGIHAARMFAGVAPHLGAVLLLISVIGSRRAQEVLEKRPCLWAGRISYSLYLSHLVVLLTLISMLHGLMPNSVILVLMIPLALALAEVLFRYVERPAIALGHLLEKRIGSSTGRVTVLPVNGVSMNTAP